MRIKVAGPISDVQFNEFYLFYSRLAKLDGSNISRSELKTFLGLSEFVTEGDVEKAIELVTVTNSPVYNFFQFAVACHLINSLGHRCQLPPYLPQHLMAYIQNLIVQKQIIQQNKVENQQADQNVSQNIDNLQFSNLSLNPSYSNTLKDQNTMSNQNSMTGQSTNIDQNTQQNLSYNIPSIYSNINQNTNQTLLDFNTNLNINQNTNPNLLDFNTNLNINQNTNPNLLDFNTNLNINQNTNQNLIDLNVESDSIFTTDQISQPIKILEETNDSIDIQLNSVLRYFLSNSDVYNENSRISRLEKELSEMKENFNKTLHLCEQYRKNNRLLIEKIKTYENKNV